MSQPLSPQDEPAHDWKKRFSDDFKQYCDLVHHEEEARKAAVTAAKAWENLTPGARIEARTKDLSPEVKAQRATDHAALDDLLYKDASSEARAEHAMREVVEAGTFAYQWSQPGNAYSEFLRRRLGPYPDDLLVSARAEADREIRARQPAYVRERILPSVKRFIQFAQEDESASDAVTRALKDVGEPQPQGFGDNCWALLMDMTVVNPWIKSRWAEERKREARAELTLKGVEAYVYGSNYLGANAYTSFLRDRYGAYPGSLFWPEGTTLVRPASWMDGGLTGDRFGPKSFFALVKTDLAPLDVLSQLSRVLTQLHSMSPWRIVPQVKGNPDDGAVAFTASARYEWDNRPYYARKGTEFVLVQSISGERRSGNGELHLKCTTAANGEDHLGLCLEFIEVGGPPMWVRRQAEERVALTLIELTGEVQAVLGSPVEWELKEGDWAVWQLLETPAGPVTLKRARDF